MKRFTAISGIKSSILGIIFSSALVLGYFFFCVWSAQWIWVSEPFDGRYDTSNGWGNVWTGPHYYPRYVTFLPLNNFIDNVLHVWPFVALLILGIISMIGKKNEQRS